jgi:NAD(P)-dependent dehydrogenase (short-subunit alcohol dehydrogenase family)
MESHQRHQPGTGGHRALGQLIGGIAHAPDQRGGPGAEHSISPADLHAGGGANVAVFVASERASFMNGAVITLDGGQRKALLD